MCALMGAALMSGERARPGHAHHGGGGGRVVLVGDGARDGTGRKKGGGAPKERESRHGGGRRAMRVRREWDILLLRTDLMQ